MASQPSKTADELTTAIRSLVDKALESQTREQIAARGREVAAAIAGTAGTAAGRASDIANDVWRDSASQRREAAKTAERMRRDALKWGRRAWLKQLQPALRNTWSRRAAAIGAAGLAVLDQVLALLDRRARPGFPDRHLMQRRHHIGCAGLADIVERHGIIGPVPPPSLQHHAKTPVRTNVSRRRGRSDCRSMRRQHDLDALRTVESQAHRIGRNRERPLGGYQ